MGPHVGTQTRHVKCSCATFYGTISELESQSALPALSQFWRPAGHFG